MTEGEWVAATNPRPMLAWLGSERQVGDRKLRLVAVAMARRAWSLLGDPYRHAVELAERFADGLADERGLRESLEGVDDYDWLGGVEDIPYLAVLPPAALDAGRVARMSSVVAFAFGQAAYPDADFDHDSYLGAAEVRASEFEAHARLVRCVFGTPFRERVRPSTSLLEWNDSLVLRLAQAVYNNRVMPVGTLDPNHLGVLADALEDAGWQDATLLEHLREPGPHCRGCFAVDAILGKE